MGPLLAAAVIPQLDGLRERMSQGGHLLDVGVGVGGLARSFCEAIPTARVVGIDVLPRALELAAQAVTARGLSDRIQLRRQGVEALEDENCFDLAWFPLPFIPPDVVREAVRRLRATLRPAGWLLIPGTVRRPGADGAIAKWQTHLVGGTLLSEEERTRLLHDAGFDSIRSIPLPPAVPQLIAARRAA